MPVYLLTIHAYRSWPEDHKRGYVQRGKGLQPPDPDRARWRNDHASQPPARFDQRQQQLIQTVISTSIDDLYACATTPTHIHILFAFRSPACQCGAAAHCNKRCPARTHVQTIATPLKRNLGARLAEQARVKGRKWLSRGCDITPVRDQKHLGHLLAAYLPDHARQNGVFRQYGP